MDDYYPKEGPNYKEEKEGLTLFGKVAIGWFRLPVAIIADGKYMESIELNKRNFANYLEILTNPELLEKEISEEKESTLFYFFNAVQSFVPH